MELTNQNSNLFFEKYIRFTNQICEKFGYEENIKHLLYVIVPAFIIKYGIGQEKLILSCVESIRILISDTNPTIGAFFYRNLKKESEYVSEKFIVINGMVKTSYLELIDSIIHELNHALNSMKNEIQEEENQVWLRTGVSYIKYRKGNIPEIIEKSEEYVLEEIINTKQTENIIELIKKIDCSCIENVEVSNCIKTVQKELQNNSYKSNAYLTQTTICQALLENKTFINTLEKLRLSGDTKEVRNWFDQFAGGEGRYDQLNRLLVETIELEAKYEKSFWKRRIISQLKKKIANVQTIIISFNQNCLYK